MGLQIIGAIIAPLKIALYWDLRSTIPNRHTGVGKHVIEVINGLRAHPDFEPVVLVASDQQVLWREQARAFDWGDLPTTTLPFSNRFGRLLSAFGIARGDRAIESCDLVYCPSEILPPFKTRPIINTIHGIPCFEKTIARQYYYSWLYYRERIKQAWFFRRCRRACRACFTVSDYLSQRLIDDFRFDSDRLYPVYNGADALFFSSSTAPNHEVDQEQISLLQVGGANVFDGASDLLKVADYLEKNYPKAKIKIAGDWHEAPWEEQLRDRVNVVWLGHLSSQTLYEEMRQATALLYLPAVESFGIIGVEAMAAGLPIIAKRTTALPEVLGEAAVWVNPAHPESIQQGLERACIDPESRRTRILDGLARARRYTWASVVEKVVEGLQLAYTPGQKL